MSHRCYFIYQKAWIGYEFITLKTIEFDESFQSPSSSDLLMLDTLVLFTYLDVSARLSISDLILPSDQKTILTGRRHHPAIFSSPGGVSIRMNIFLNPWTTLSNCPSTNDLSAVLKSLSKTWTRFPSSEIRKRVGQFWELRGLKPVPLQKAAQIGNFALVNPKVSLCSARRGEPR